MNKSLLDLLQWNLESKLRTAPAYRLGFVFSDIFLRGLSQSFTLRGCINLGQPNVGITGRVVVTVVTDSRQYKGAELRLPLRNCLSHVRMGLQTVVSACNNGSIKNPTDGPAHRQRWQQHTETYSMCRRLAPKMHWVAAGMCVRRASFGDLWPKPRRSSPC